MVFALPSTPFPGKPQKLTGHPEEVFVEPTGHVFAIHYRTQVLGEEVEFPVEEELDRDVAAEEEARLAEEKKKKKKKKGKSKNMSKRAKEEGLQDHYEALELDDVGWHATTAQIEAAYRKLIVLKHPDKMPGQDPAAFIAVQEAYDTLMNEQRRRVYDSQYDTNDSLPSGQEKGEKYFEVFGECFVNNARWSETQPMPEFGNMDTPMDKVDEFYDAWRGFKSWRDFSMDCEHSETHMRGAEDRETKRMMMRENEAFAKRKKKDEVKRLTDLVDIAYKADPRIKRRKIEKELAKAQEETRKKQEAEAKAAEEARVKAEAEEAEKQSRMDNKKAKEGKAKALKDSRRRLRKAAEALGLGSYETEKLCAGLSVDEMATMSEALEAGESGKARFQAAVDRLTAEGK